tara:strand:- start:24064 stop:25110 length:1047 start_codon:yes stop_codon:yes gene_type:complete
MGKSKAPSVDPNVGIAALRTAELGEDYLTWAKEQSKVSEAWALEDRERYKNTFEPLQDQFIEEAQNFDTPEARAAAAREAVSDVRQQTAMAQEASGRNLARMGVDPRSGRAADAGRQLTLQSGLSAAGAANTARRSVEAQGRQLRAAAVDLGSGMAVNPATSLGMSNNTTASGFSAAMNGNQSKGNMLLGQHQAQMQQWQANQNSSGSLFGALGNIAGMALFSSKELKENKRQVKRSLLKAVRKTPVEDWTYKKGVADEGSHTGPYAEDFQKNTGHGDGKSIPVVDMVGTMWGALQELDKNVTQLSRQISPKARDAAGTQAATRKPQRSRSISSEARGTDRPQMREVA